MPISPSVPAASAPAPAAAGDATANASEMGRPFGRFRLLQLLGRSEHAMAWRAFDPRLAQEVMLTMPRTQPADAEALSQWLQRVKGAARLSHPNLAHVVEVGVESHWPYVAVDRALGLTLEEWLQAHPAPSPMESVGWLCQLLQGLAFAHEAGVAHGSVESFSVLISEQGVLRWVGLGVANTPSLWNEAEARSHLDTRSLQAQRSLAVQDVLTLGLLLHRLLSGEMPLGRGTLAAAVERLAPQGAEGVRLLRTTPQPLSEALRAIANRATSSQSRQRYLSARTFLRALEGWRDSETQGRGGPLAVLMDRLSSVGHLPSRRAAGRGATPSRWESLRVDEIAEQILQDMGLTLELLRQVNSAQVQGTQAAGAPPVLTVRRAVALLGMNGVRRCGTALREWPGPLQEPGAAALQEAMDRVWLAGGVAQQLAPAGYDPEVIYLVTLMQNLGRLLVHYHFADEAEQIRHLMRPTPPPTPGAPEQAGLTETTASFGVLGIDLETLGASVAKHCGLGDDMQHMMHRLSPGRPVRQPDTDVDWLRAAASAANDVVDAVTWLPSTQSGAALAAVAQRYARVLGVELRDVHDALKQARDMVRQGEAIVRGSGVPVAAVAAVAPAAVAVPAEGAPQGASLRARLLAKAARPPGTPE
jgi:hypothetical protein